MQLALSKTERRLGAASLLLLAACVPELAFADTTDCTSINTLPHVISTPGHYCLGGPLVSNQVSGEAITINADNVVLDCNNHAITHNVIAPVTAIRGASRRDVEVRNCRLVNFTNGMDFLSSTTRRIWIHDNVVFGARNVGLSILGRDVEVSRNLVTDTGGVRAIRVTSLAGGSALVRDNVVRKLDSATSTLVGFEINGTGRSTLVNNVVREVGVPTTTHSIAIRVGTDVALAVAPVVIRDGALFRDEGVKNWSVQIQPGTAKSVCESVDMYDYSILANPGCL